MTTGSNHDSTGRLMGTNQDIVTEPQGTNQSNLSEVAILFLRLGLTAFGGPAAHIAIMEDEVVRRRRWITQERFLDLLGAVNLIPGPNSTEMAIYLGYLRAGWMGLILGGICFIFPAMLMVMGIAWAYVRYGGLPQFEALLYGVKPVVIAVILQALWGLGRRAVKTKVLAVIGLLAVAAAGYFAVNALAVILVGGVMAGLVRGRTQEHGKRFKPILVMLVIAGGILAFSYFAARLGNTTEAQVGLQPLFLYFLKIGSILYGSGYVLLAFLQSDLVARWHWLTSAQLLDATAVGQVTPGPVFTTATFIGYVLGGVTGAIVATVGIFLPSFVLIAVSGPIVPRIRKSPIAGAFLDGVNVASLALMAVVTWQLGRAAIFDLTTALLVIVSAILLMRFRFNSAWLILGGAAVGMLMQMSHIGG
jgi:chromate transporter